MTARRKIAEFLRGLARSIDDTPHPSRAEIDARYAAIMAIPRSVNRFVGQKSFSNSVGGVSILANPLVLKLASAWERSQPSLYADNQDMLTAIANYRSGPDIALLVPTPRLVPVETLPPGRAIAARLLTAMRGGR